MTPVQLPIGEPRSNQGPPAVQTCSIYLPHAHQKWVQGYCINASGCFRDKIIARVLGTYAVVRIKGYTWCQLSTARLPCLVERRCRSAKTAPIAIKRWRFRLVLLGETQLDSPFSASYPLFSSCLASAQRYGGTEALRNIVDRQNLVASICFC